MAAGRISVHLCKTSWPPGRGSRAGQTQHLEAVARDSRAWHHATLGQGQHSLAPRHPWPGLSVLPVAGDPVSVQSQGWCCAWSVPGCSP